MLRRQRVILGTLREIGRPLSATVFVKLIFLLRHETQLQHDPSFYDFVPYKRGPFSFALYRELMGLQKDGYLSADENSVMLTDRVSDLREDEVRNLGPSTIREISGVLQRYGGMSSSALISSVYTRYPWYAQKSELPERRMASHQDIPKTTPAVFTGGYEGKSVDGFLAGLLERGIERIIDVRANAASRRYGFSGSRLQDISARVGLGYSHVPGASVFQAT